MNLNFFQILLNTKVLLPTIGLFALYIFRQRNVRLLKRETLNNVELNGFLKELAKSSDVDQKQLLGIKQLLSSKKPSIILEIFKLTSFVALLIYLLNSYAAEYEQLKEKSLGRTANKNFPTNEITRTVTQIKNNIKSDNRGNNGNIIQGDNNNINQGVMNHGGKSQTTVINPKDTETIIVNQ